MAPKFDPITEPGVYDISEEQYHADPAFSSSHARLLIDTCPAKLRHAIDNPQPPNRKNSAAATAAAAAAAAAGRRSRGCSRGTSISLGLSIQKRRYM